MEEITKVPRLSEAERTQIIQAEFLPHMDHLYNFAFRLTYNETDAADLVQDTYLKACKAVETYELGTNAKAWLFTILRNIFINDYRKKSKMPKQGNIEDIEKQHHTQDGTKGKHLDLSAETFQDMLGDEVMEAIESLKVDFKTIILLDQEDFKYAEMSAILEIPVGTVRSRLYRARQTLKLKLQDYGRRMGYFDADSEEPTE